MGWRKAAPGIPPQNPPVSCSWCGAGLHLGWRWARTWPVAGERQAQPSTSPTAAHYRDMYQSIATQGAAQRHPSCGYQEDIAGGARRSPTPAQVQPSTRPCTSPSPPQVQPSATRAAATRKIQQGSAKRSPAPAQLQPSTKPCTSPAPPQVLPSATPAAATRRIQRWSAKRSPAPAQLQPSTRPCTSLPASQVQPSATPAAATRRIQRGRGRRSPAPGPLQPQHQAMYQPTAIPGAARRHPRCSYQEDTAGGRQAQPNTSPAAAPLYPPGSCSRGGAGLHLWWRWAGTWPGAGQQLVWRWAAAGTATKNVENATKNDEIAAKNVGDIIKHVEDDTKNVENATTNV